MTHSLGTAEDIAQSYIIQYMSKISIGIDQMPMRK